MTNPRRQPTPTRYRRAPLATLAELDARRHSVQLGINHLDRALEAFKGIAPATAAYVRRCRASAYGAKRHADSKYWAKWREEGSPRT